jgi:hypothetical protein
MLTAGAPYSKKNKDKRVVCLMMENGKDDQLWRVDEAVQKGRIIVTRKRSHDNLAIKLYSFEICFGARNNFYFYCNTCA